MQLMGRLPGTESGPIKKYPKQFRWQCSSCSPNFKLEPLRLHSRAGCDRRKTIETSKHPPIPPTFTDQCNLNNDSTKKYTQETSKTTVGSNTSPPKGTQPQIYLVATEQSPQNKTGKEPVPFLSCYNNYLTGI